MTGSVALDVVIGLVFIYLLYSLFATVIMEIITSSFGLRARNLRYALRRMLMDEREFENGWFPFIRKFIFKMLNTVLKIFGWALNLKNTETFESFYNQPTIKYLSSGGISNKPSYLTAQNFSKALIDTLNSSFNGKKFSERTENDSNTENNSELLLKKITNSILYWCTGNKTKYFKENKVSISLLAESETKENLKLMLTDAENDSSKFEKLLDKWFKNKNSLEKIKTGIDILPAGSHTKKHLESLLVDANNDLLKFKLSLEQWFDDTMERSTGWFKRRVQYILFIIGFFLAVSFNADTLVIVKKLSKDPEARQQLVDMAINYAKENKETIAYIDSIKKISKDKQDSILKDKENYILLNRIDTLLSVTKSINADIYEAQNIFSSNWRIPDKLIVISDSIKSLKDSLVFEHELKVFLDIDEDFKKLGCTKTVHFAVHQSIDTTILKNIIPEKIHKGLLASGIPVNKSEYKRKYVFAADGFLNFKHLWGYILTALAISLGSPFWFDLLNKLIKLRSSVSQSNSKQSTTTKPNPNDPASPKNRVA